jgi:hypothetical protein
VVLPLEPYLGLVKARRLMSSVRVLALRDLGRLPVDREWIEVRRGDEVGIPLWLALELSRRGYVELREGGLRDTELHRYHLLERGSKGGKLAEVREDLYLVAGLTLGRLYGEGSGESLVRADRMKSVLANLLDIRVGKLVNAVVSVGDKQPSEITPVLEEMLLFKFLRRALEVWRSSVLGYAELWPR